MKTNTTIFYTLSIVLLIQSYTNQQQNEASKVEGDMFVDNNYFSNSFDQRADNSETAVIFSRFMHN